MTLVIELDNRHARMLKKLCAEWFAIPGKDPLDSSKALNMLIESEYQKFDPPTYQTSGFERLD